MKFHSLQKKTLFLLLSKLVFREQFKEQLCSNLCPILCTTLSTNFHKGEKHGNTFLFKSIVHKCYSNIHMEGGCQCQCLNTKKILSVSAFYIVCHKMFVASSAIAGQDLVICIYRRQVDLKFCGPYMCWTLVSWKNRQKPFEDALVRTKEGNFYRTLSK